MFRKLLVPLDRSWMAERAVGQAAAIARANGGEIDLVLVHEPVAVDGYADAPWNHADWTAEANYLETVSSELRAGANVQVTCIVLRGGAAEMILRRAKDASSDLIVMTSHGRTGLSRMWLGSVADAVVRRSDIPVLVLRPTGTPMIRPATRHRFRRILVPTDGSPFSAAIADSAVALAKATGATLTLLHVVQPVPLLVPIDADIPVPYPPAIPDEEATRHLVETCTTTVLESARQLSESQALPVDAKVLVSNHVATSIIDYARAHDIDAIAMSTHGRGASRLFFGSVADKVLRSSNIPVLVRKPVSVVEATATLTDADVTEQLPALSSR